MGAYLAEVSEAQEWRGTLDSSLEKTGPIPNMCRGRTFNEGDPLVSKKMVRAIYSPSLLALTSLKKFPMVSSSAVENKV